MNDKMRKVQRDEHVIDQAQRRLHRLVQFQAYSAEHVKLTHLPFDDFAPVEGVPGLCGRAIVAPESYAKDVSLVLFKWEKVDEKLHEFGMHYHDERETITPVVGHLEMEIEGEGKIIGPGDSEIIGRNVLHRKRPLEGCLFYTSFEPPLPRTDG